MRMGDTIHLAADNLVTDDRTDNTFKLAEKKFINYKEKVAVGFAGDWTPIMLGKRLVERIGDQLLESKDPAFLFYTLWLEECAGIIEKLNVISNDSKIECTALYAQANTMWIIDLDSGVLEVNAEFCGVGQFEYAIGAIEFKILMNNIKYDPMNLLATAINIQSQHVSTVGKNSTHTKVLNYGK